MIVFDLECAGGHRFEGWFQSTDDFEHQNRTAMLRCPQCDGAQVTKAPMAPAVSAKGNTRPRSNTAPAVTKTAAPRELAAALRALADLQAKTLHKSEWVGERFAQEVRSMHYGETDEKLVHGRATPEEAAALLDEGIAVAPLLVPVSPSDELN